MLRDPAFFWRPNNTASRGRGEGKNGSATKFKKNDLQEGNFLNSFVQDCRIEHDFPGPLPIVQVIFKTYLPSKKIYLSWTGPLLDSNF